MKAESNLRRQWRVAAIAGVLALSGVSTAQADTYVHNAWGNSNVIFGPACNNPPASALQFNATRNPTDGNPPFQGNKLLMLSDASYTQPYFNCVESTTWTSTSAQRKAATIDGVYENPNPTSIDDFYLPIQRSITLRNLTLQNVDLSTETVDFNFRPVSGDSSLTLNNSSLNTLNRPGFYLPAHFNLAASGDSLIRGWTGRIDSQTTLNVTPGGKLTLDWCGNMNASLVTSSMYFAQIDNAATIDGGTLRLQQSYVTFGASAFDPAHPSKMTFKNAARLEVTGDNSTLVADAFDFINSTLMLANNNNLRVRGTLTLDTTSVVVGSSGVVGVPALVVKGLSTMALGDPRGLYVQPVQAGAMQMQADAILTLTGTGGLQTEFLDFVAPGGGHQYGQIVINDNAELITGTDGIFRLQHGDIVTINRTGEFVSGLMLARKGGVINYGLSNQVTNHLTNHGQIDADDQGAFYFFGDATILGGSEGKVSINSGGVLGAGLGAVQPAIQRLTTNNTVELDNFSTLQLTLDPTNSTHDQVRVGSTLWIEQWAGLNLSVVNDKVLLSGTKFILVDYNGWQGNYAQKTFNGYPDGSTLVLGLNTYQIKYADSGDAGYAGAITLTVVAPVPPAATLLPATQTLTGTVGIAFTPSAAMVPTGFVGAVTYSITPILPAGLSLAIATGIISGVPAEILASTPFTIRGVGATSGVAMVTATIAVGTGSQTISFSPTPPPTFAPSGGFLVSASASSSLPVTFASTTLAVCTVVDDTVFMLSAGTCTIVASQAGNINYNPAPPVTQSIIIAKAQPALILSADPGFIVLGGSSMLTTKSDSAGAISYAVTGPCTLHGVNELRGNAIGTCSVTAIQAADGNYNAGRSDPLAVEVRPVPPIPTLSDWALLILASMLVALTGWPIRGLSRRRA